MVAASLRGLRRIRPSGNLSIRIAPIATKPNPTPKRKRKAKCCLAPIDPPRQMTAPSRAANSHLRLHDLRILGASRMRSDGVPQQKQRSTLVCPDLPMLALPGGAINGIPPRKSMQEEHRQPKTALRGNPPRDPGYDGASFAPWFFGGCFLLRCSSRAASSMTCSTSAGWSDSSQRRMTPRRSGLVKR